ncbi:MAG: ABC transporter ATP-binding protein [Fibrobacterota bacterium]|nr:ABC transporter ATP-binding protein [Fibrobacterota bacterium]QQS07254.1 MAG: ABC transporter ATP-binding protein [Fibrobacterota bacterium]
MDAVLETRGLRKSYHLGNEEVPVLHGIDFLLGKGEYGAIMGPSGSGKSTLLNILGCLDRPTAGQYLVEGREVGGLSENELADLRARSIGFVFQSFNLLPRLTLWQNVELPLQYLGISRSERRRRVDETMARLGLSERGKHLPLEVSGGQRQRAAIARALVKQPAILLADEPTGNLDSTTTSEVLKLFAELHAEGNTILMITHEREVADRAARRWHILDGRMSEIS